MTLNTLDIVSRYARRFNRGLNEHSISSPLGAWLLLNLVALDKERLSEDEQRALEEVLEVDLETALERFRLLFALPPESAKIALGAWMEEDELRRLRDWAAIVAPYTGLRAGIPTKKELDAWTDESTMGLIKSFPARPSSSTKMILASALATKISWTHPFIVAPADDYPVMFGWGVNEVLLSPPSHTVQIFTDGLNVYGVHAATSTDGMTVYSVICDDDQMAPEYVLEAAYRIARGKQQDVTELALDGDVTPSQEMFEVRESRTDNNFAVLPAWQAKSEINLKENPDSGAAELVSYFAKKGLAEGGDTVVSQSAAASYSKDGFEAAAVTTMLTATNYASSPLRKILVLPFARPYAVIAVASSENLVNGQPDQIPVFQAWVTQAVEP